MAERPIFYDASGRRRQRFRLAVVAFVALILLAVALFIASVGVVPAAPLLPVQADRPVLKELPAPRDPSVLRRTRRDVGYYARQLFGSGNNGQRQPGATGNPALAIAFHAPWDESSGASLKRHVEQLDWLIPGWISVTGPKHQVTYFRDVVGRSVLNAAAHRPAVLPMVQNAVNGDWDGPGSAALFADVKARRAFLDELVGYLAVNHASGACFDFEDLTPAALVDYRAFLADAQARFKPHGWLVTITAQLNNGWNLRSFAQVTDKVFLMAYDEHENNGEPGPIASQRWFARMVANEARGIPPAKLVVALGSYGYDWAAARAASPSTSRRRGSARAIRARGRPGTRRAAT